LGQDPRVERIQVHWPAGGCDSYNQWNQAGVDRIVTLREQSGQACSDVKPAK
jgi:hypothetical protein